MILHLRLLAVLVGLTGVFSLHAQKEGDIWVTGYSASIKDPEFGLAYWRFDNLYPRLEYQIDITFSLQETNASISSNVGKVLLMTNGMEIRTPEMEHICDTIAYLDGEHWAYWFREHPPMPFGFPKRQSAICLPVPGTTNEFSVIYYHAVLDTDDVFFAVVSVLETRLRLEDNGAWTIVFKDREVLRKATCLSQGTWHACRHANGRDWWLLMHDYEGDTYYRLLFDPEGIRLDGTQTLPEPRNLLHNGWFSPDGSKYAKYHATSLLKADLNLYDFDRCTGLLSSHKNVEIIGEALTYQGMAFSPDSRYIYVTRDGLEMYQYDTWAADLEASAVLVDTNDGYIEPNWFPTTFGPMMPGPDGRIYMFPTSGSSRAVHVIDRPNERGKEAKLLQHHIMLQTSNARSIQNFPNYRLGPLDGSACDTLGLDNHPQSRWRYEIENSDPLEIRFTDLSFFRPEVWSWDFGDGETSSEVHPIHTYAAPGLYYACLTVSNEYSADTSCQWIEIESVSSENIDQDEAYLVYPNPFSEHIEITPPDGYKVLEFTLIDTHGRIVVSPEVTCPCRIKLSHLPDGMYFYSVKEEGKVLRSGKVLKAQGG